MSTDNPNTRLTDEILHCLHDTIILLGGEAEIAEMLLHPEEFNESALDALGQYTINLLESTKGRLININKMEVTPTGSKGERRYSFRTSLSC